MKHIFFIISLLMITDPLMASSKGIDFTSEDLIGQPIPVKKRDTGLYVAQVKPDLFFVLEQINGVNHSAWREFARTNALSRNQRLMKNMSAIGSFIDGLQQGQWVAYATHTDVLDDQTNSALMEKSIEMVVTVSTKDGPFTIHHGITRIGTYMLAKQVRHPRISVGLHAFAAKVMLMEYPKKIYMMASPVKGMKRILQKNLKAGTYFIGDNLDIISLKEDLKKIGQVKCTRVSYLDSLLSYNKKLLSWIKDHKLSLQQTKSFLEKDQKDLIQQKKKAEKIVKKDKPKKLKKILQVLKDEPYVKKGDYQKIVSLRNEFAKIKGDGGKQEVIHLSALISRNEALLRKIKWSNDLQKIKSSLEEEIGKMSQKKQEAEEIFKKGNLEKIQNIRQDLHYMEKYKSPIERTVTRSSSDWSEEFLYLDYKYVIRGLDGKTIVWRTNDEGGWLRKRLTVPGIFFTVPLKTLVKKLVYRAQKK